jgi:hypothetical protein
MPMLVENRLGASLEHPNGLDEVWDTDEDDGLMLACFPVDKGDCIAARRKG